MHKVNDILYVYIGDISMTIDVIGLIPQRFCKVHTVDEIKLQDDSIAYRYSLTSLYSNNENDMYQEYVIHSVDSVFKVATIPDLIALVNNKNFVDEKKAELLTLINDTYDTHMI